MQYHSRNFTYMYFFSNAFDLIRVWNLRRMNSYRYEMFRETFLSCIKSNAYEIVVFDWSMSIIVTSFKMGDTRGLSHSQNNVITPNVSLCRISRLKCKFWWQWTCINSVTGGCETVLSVVQIKALEIPCRLLRCLRQTCCDAIARCACNIPAPITKTYLINCSAVQSRGKKSIAK